MLASDSIVTTFLQREIIRSHNIFSILPPRRRLIASECHVRVALQDIVAVEVGRSARAIVVCLVKFKLAFVVAAHVESEVISARCLEPTVHLGQVGATLNGDGVLVIPIVESARVGRLVGQSFISISCLEDESGRQFDHVAGEVTPARSASICWIVDSLDQTHLAGHFVT